MSRNPSNDRAPRRNQSFGVENSEQILRVRSTHIGRLLLQAHRAFHVFAVRKLQERGHDQLGMAHTTILPYVEPEGTRIVTLARMVGMTKQAVGEVVRQLAELGYVECTPDPLDRRATLVTFTAIGWQFLKDAHDIKVQIETEYTKLLGASRMRELRRSLLEVMKVGDVPESEHQAPPARSKKRTKASRGGPR